jgi:hypothetical protein
MQLLLARDGNTSLEELQGAVEYLLDKIKAARMVRIAKPSGNRR